MRGSKIQPAELRPGLVAKSLGRWSGARDVNIDYDDIVVFLCFRDARLRNVADGLSVLWEVMNPRGVCHRIRVSPDNFESIE